MFFTRKPVDWQKLQGRAFQTITGARFSIVRVTAKTITIRPEHGTRNYAISIQNELEPVLDDYATGRFFPSPSELLRIGVRAVQTPYVWGILHALDLNDAAKVEASGARVADFVGRWHITKLSELDQDYFDESDESPFIEMRVSHSEYITGRYHFSLSSGSIEGELREFGGEVVLLFAYAGNDEMDEVNGIGWLQVKDREQLTGEFISTYGRLTAEHVRGEFTKRGLRPRKKQK